MRAGRTVKRVRIAGCWYRTLDADAGIRAYAGQRGARRFWHGYYNQKAVCHFTGGVLFSGVYSASRQEYHLFDDVYDTTCRILGTTPDSDRRRQGLLGRQRLQEVHDQRHRASDAVAPRRRLTEAPRQGRP